MLWRFAPPAVEERNTGTPDSGAHDVEWLVLAGFADRDTADRAAAAIHAEGLGVATVQPVGDHGLDGWREFARPERADPFVVVPTWVPYAPTAGEVVLTVDPGSTFGSGSHPTTRLVLRALARLVPQLDGTTSGQPRPRVLDVGCGSGVLAVGAARLGMAAVGIDIDPAAPAALTANATRNAVADLVTFDPRPLTDVVTAGERFELVLANLLSPLVVELSPSLTASVAPGGHVVVSGLLAQRLGPAIAALTSSGRLHEVDRAIEAGWVAVTLRASSP